ncbi:hypothetical protein E2C01_013287 [Portunus trituberculatus]|uniref:Uncharacterized protein n=1 Tax=Portunus trituberculatus TaxID=210409 RepID=A0A5B7DGV6_PORTR|nr:hypothetical protein [Portunus trituberculatus]
MTSQPSQLSTRLDTPRGLSDQTGVSVRQVQQYVKHIAELGSNNIPTKKKHPQNLPVNLESGTP